MALKAVLDSAPAEPVKSFYVEKDGKYVLDVEGMVPEVEHVQVKTKLNEFRENNRTMFNQIENEFKPKLKQYEGVDPEEYRTLKEEKEKLGKKGVKAADDVESLIKAHVTAAVKPLQETIAKQEAERARLKNDLETQAFNERVVAAATKAGVDPTFMPDVIERAHKLFKPQQDGKRAAMNEDGQPIYDSKGEAPLTVDAWIPALPKPFFLPSSGGGANGSGAAGHTGKHEGPYRLSSGSEVKTDGITVL